MDPNVTTREEKYKCYTVPNGWAIIKKKKILFIIYIIKHFPSHL